MAKSKKPKKKRYRDLTDEERVAYRADAHARNKKRIEKYDPVKAAINAWRREFSRSPVVIDMMNDPATKRHFPRYKKDGTRAKVDGVEHLCTKCGQWKRGQFAIDHITPFIDPHVGFVGFDTAHERLWCARENLQKLCKDCHQVKSVGENMIRALKREYPELEQMEQVSSKATLKKYLKRYSDERLIPYPADFKGRIFALRGKLSKM